MIIAGNIHIPTRNPENNPKVIESGLASGIEFVVPLRRRLNERSPNNRTTVGNAGDNFNMTALAKTAPPKNEAVRVG